MNRFKDKTLAEIVSADHRTASVFEKYSVRNFAVKRPSIHTLDHHSDQKCNSLVFPE